MYLCIKGFSIPYRSISADSTDREKMRCSKSVQDLLIFSLMDARNPQEPFVKKYLSLLSYCIFFADKFPNMILLYSLKSSHKRTPETLNKCTFFCLKKAIPQKQEIWNCNSVGNKWYVALLWIINESRRALVLPSCPSVIQTFSLPWAWHGRLTGGDTHTYTHGHIINLF